ncbi:MAG: hypothetical protein HYX73_02755 [Acidobacteria bacterium]|nr:hypothetical protein [Acidobacteriota bacterium]
MNARRSIYSPQFVVRYLGISRHGSGGVRLGKGEMLVLRMASDATYSPARVGVSEDACKWMIHLREIRLLHPAPDV